MFNSNSDLLIHWFNSKRLIYILLILYTIGRKRNEGRIGGQKGTSAMKSRQVSFLLMKTSVLLIIERMVRLITNDDFCSKTSLGYSIKSLYNTITNMPKASLFHKLFFSIREAVFIHAHEKEFNRTKSTTISQLQIVESIHFSVLKRVNQCA